MGKTAEASHAEESGPALAPHGAGPWVRFLAPAVVGVAADLWVKAYAFPGGVDLARGVNNGLNPATKDEPWVVIPKVLGFTTTVNQGAVFGTGQGLGWLFVVFSFVALAAIVWVFLRSERRQIWLHLALGLIMAGAIGNLYDRLAYGGVRDMLKLLCFQFQRTAADGTVSIRDYYPYVFNVADVLLCVGVPLLMLCWLFQKEPGAGAAGRGKEAGRA